MYDILLAFVLVAVGLITGSYLNSWIWRIHEGKWLPLRSVCVHCKRQLAWYENVPLVSFLWLKGKCKTCGGKIPADYFWVELVTPVVLMLTVFYDLNYVALNPWRYFRDIFFTILLIEVFVYDFKYSEILPRVTWGGAIVAGLINFYLLNYSIYKIGLGIILVAGFFLFQYVFSRGRWIGGGDVRFGVTMGALLGWPLGLIALAISYIVGGLISVMLLVKGRKNMDSAIPFGTFLAIGTWISMLAGAQIITWYLGLVRW